MIQAQRASIKEMAIFNNIEATDSELAAIKHRAVGDAFVITDLRSKAEKNDDEVVEWIGKIKKEYESYFGENQESLRNKINDIHERFNAKYILTDSHLLQMDQWCANKNTEVSLLEDHTEQLIEEMAVVQHTSKECWDELKLFESQVANRLIELKEEVLQDRLHHGSVLSEHRNLFRRQKEFNLMIQRYYWYGLGGLTLAVFVMGLKIFHLI